MPTCSWLAREGSGDSRDCCSARSASSAHTTPRARSRSCPTAAGRADAEEGGRMSVDLDRLSAHWRLALNSAQDAVQAASLYLPASEQRALRTELTAERGDTARLLDAIARDEHVHLVHRVNSPRPSRRMLGLSQEVDACV